MEEKKHNKRGKEIQQCQLPEDVIFQQILPWLPIKSLTRCKVISKNWYNTISSPNFILKHTKQPLFTHFGPPVETLLIQTGKKFYLYSCDDDDNVVTNHTFDEENYHGFFDSENCCFNDEEDKLIKLNKSSVMSDIANDAVHLVGCSNGLVCLGEKNDGKYFILWNPSINQSHKYYPDYVQVCDLNTYLRRRVYWEFGHVSSLDDYFVVRVVKARMRYFFTRCVVDVYSLKTNTNKRMELGATLFCVDQPRLVNGTLYWIALCEQIVAYDLVRDTFVTCPDLTLLKPSPHFMCHLYVMGGCLAMYTLNTQNERVLNIVKSPGRVVSVPCDLSREYCSDLIGFTKTGSIFVALQESSSAMLGLFDPTHNSKQSLIDFDRCERIYVSPYVSSQNLPLPPAELPVASGQQVA